MNELQKLHAQTLDAFLGALHASGLATEDLGVQVVQEPPLEVTLGQPIELEAEKTK